MRAVEFTSEISERGELRVPEKIAHTLPHATKVRVIVLVSGEGDDADEWRDLAAEQFVKGYADSDSIYDEE